MSNQDLNQIMRNRGDDFSVKSRSATVRPAYAFLAACTFVASIAVPPALATRAQTLPSNAKALVTVPPATFDGWFKTGAVTLNGVVNPADSLNFSNSPNGDFYRWSWQMFLWATSPAPPTYGGGAHIFDSSVFYDVSPESGGVRTLLAHPVPSLARGIKRFVPSFRLRAAQVGPHGLPVIMSKAGQLLEIVPPARPTTTSKTLISSKALFVLDRTSKLVQVPNFKVVNKRVMFLDGKGKQILGAHPSFPKKFQTKRFVAKLVLNGRPIFVDLANNVIDTEVGQADEGVLMAQNGSLIYYRSMVNDVYAYFLTGVKDGGIAPTSGNSVVVGGTRFFIFPTDSTGLGQVTTFAGAHGKTFPDPNALAVEIKSSWVEASTLPNPGDYITAVATIPTYNTPSPNPNHWTPTGSKTTLMALVGMHFVGSTKGHPEMVWATFEHFGNTPNETYKYQTSSNTVANVPRDSVIGPWLFCSPTHTGSFNVPHMTNDATVNANIDSTTGFTISPSDTLRFIPFGSAINTAPNPLDSSDAVSNSEIISIDNNIMGQLAVGDLRGKYMLTGATWTIGGLAPNGSFGNPGNPGGNGVGTSQMGNSTMETYQSTTNAFNAFGNNCFSCHVSDSPTVSTAGVSHLFPVIKKLF